MDMSKKENILQGIYTGHVAHFPNQAENVFIFIIDDAENTELIGKGVSQRSYFMKREDEQKK